MMKRETGLKVWCGLVVLCAVATAPAADRLFDFQQTQLDNGLQVITLEDFSTPIVTVQVWYHVGSKNEDPNRQGFAHMFEHMMFRGTELVEPEEHANLIQKVGGMANAFTSFDMTVYHQTLPVNQVELAMWLEAERMAFLAVNQENFDVERQVVEEELRMYRDQPYGTLGDQILAEVFKQHPYRWMVSGKIAHLRAASVQELRDFWQTYYVPNNATLIVVGAIEHDRAVKLADKYFGWITPGEEPPRVTVKEPLPTAAREITLKEAIAPATIVGILYRTVPEAHPDQVPLELLATILGGGQSSRLHRDLVAEQQAVAVVMAGTQTLEQAGLMAVGGVLPPMGGQPAEKVIASMEKHVAQLREELVSEEELTKAKNQMLKGIVLPQLSIESKAMAIGSAVINAGDPEFVNRQIARVKAVTREDLRRVAREYLRDDQALKGKVEGNMIGSLMGGKKHDDGEITAEPEKQAPPPGRPGLQRPEDYPTKPPMAGLLEGDPEIDTHEETLDNGLKVVVIPNHEVPYVSMQLGLRNGAFTEEQPGAAYTAAAMLTKGTTAHDEAELAEALETYAISLSAAASMDGASVAAGCLTDQLDRAIALLAEVVRQPTFPAEEFKKLVMQMRTGLTIEESSPEFKADRQLRRVLYGEHPYSRTAQPSLDTIDALKVGHAAEWWRTFARPEDAVLIFAGDVTAERAMQLARQAFGDWQVTQARPDIDLPPLPEPRPMHIYLVDHPGKQSQIRMAHLGITRHNPDYYTGMVVRGYFGMGGFASRLSQTIRVEKGLTYGVTGGHFADRFAGRFAISTFSKTERTAEAIEALLEEVARLHEEPPNTEELTLVKNFVLGSFVARHETPQQIAEDIWLVELEGLPQDYFSRLLSGVRQATADDCIELVTETVHADKLAIIVVGDADEMVDELTRIAPVTLIEADGSEKELPQTKPAASAEQREAA